MARGVVLAVRSDDDGDESTYGATLSVPLVLLLKSVRLMSKEQYITTKYLRLLRMIDVNTDEHQSLLSECR